jgi:hypothetical protein
MPAESHSTADPGAVLEQFVASLPPDREALVRRLHALIAGTHPAFDVAIKYNLLMYAIGADWRHWVVAIDGHPKSGVGLKFLYGVLLPDPRHVLRAGTSVLMSWDLPEGSVVDDSDVRTYVADAVRLYPEYRANDKAILASARASASK